MLYFSETWESQSPDISYGHDIEGSWLLWEAAEIIGDPELNEYVKPISLKMAKLFLMKDGIPRAVLSMKQIPKREPYMNFVHGGYNQKPW
jgi:hypothetical protein